MLFRRLILASLAPFLTLSAQQASQTPPSPITFLAADVHPAPRRAYPFFQPVRYKDDRYVIRDATMIDLIASAYGLDGANVQSGPSWLERDRFDIFAKIPPGTTPPTLKLMLRTLLAERFHLALHNGTQPMPAYILAMGSGKPKLEASQGSGDPACHDGAQPDPAAPVNNVISCRNMTMDDFAEQIHQMAGGYLDKPVVNATHLDGSFDFGLKWTSRGNLAKAGPDGISVFDAVQKQLGLKLSLETSPRPVVLVDAVSRTPTANVAGIEKILPPPPPPQFEVATIKPSKPGTPNDGHIGGDEIKFTGVPLRLLIDLAWDLTENDPENIVNAPKWLDDDKFDILAKTPPESVGKAGPGRAPMDIYEAEVMLRALLTERFQLKAHMEDRPTDAYTLVAANPKLKPADPSGRTVCKEGPGPDGKDPRIANPMQNRLISCRNMTMAEICDELQRVAGGYIYEPVLDSTGLSGSYDFTLSFSSANAAQHGGIRQH